jgi:hypothetical protein
MFVLPVQISGTFGGDTLEDYIVPVEETFIFCVYSYALELNWNKILKQLLYQWL